MHGISNAYLTLLFYMIAFAPSLGVTGLFFLLAKILKAKRKETAYKFFRVLTGIGVAACVILLLFCAFMYLEIKFGSGKKGMII